MIRRSILVTLLAALGCSRPSEPSPDGAVEVASPAAENGAGPPTVGTSLPVSQPEVKKPDVPPPTFAYPPDLGGQALPRVVTPAGPPLPPTERLGQKPTVRNPPARVLNPDPATSKVYVPATVLLPRPTGLKPTAPAEKVPADLGAGAEAVPAKPVLPEGQGVTQKGPDVNDPPKLPPLGRPLPDRAPLDDPTADAGNAAIAGQSKTPVLGPSPFVKFGLPDPFELAAQVKPRVPSAAEPGALPVPVNPERKK
jgi:hypothetical protein